MIVFRKIKIKIDNKEEFISIGMPDNEKEMHDMFSLRFSEYSNRGYIDPSRFPNKIEKDEYDGERSTYFIATWNEKIIGTIRLIKDHILPTEKVFKFKEIEEIAKIPREKRAEFGRFIIIPPDKGAKKYLPRGLLMISMFDVLFEHCTKNGLLGGYSFIKKSLDDKMRKKKIPIRRIENYIQDYPKDGILSKYFSQKNDPVIPIAFITEEFKKFLDHKFSNKMVFSKTPDTIVFKDNFYTTFLKKIKII